MDRSNFVLKPLKADLGINSTRCDSLANIPSARARWSTGTSIAGAPADDSYSPLSRSHPPVHLGRVATVDRHDEDAWDQEWKVHNTRLAVAMASSLNSNGAPLAGCSPNDGAADSLSSMEFGTQRPQAEAHFPGAGRPGEGGTAPRSHDWTYLVAPDLDISSMGRSPAVLTSLCEDLGEGRRRVGEILVRCGVLNFPRVSGDGSAATKGGSASDVHPSELSAFRMASRLPPGDIDERLTAALANWTSEWVHTLVIQPYGRGCFRFRYQGSSNVAPNYVASRIRRVLSHVHNPLQVAIHALWSISVLTSCGRANASFLSVPILRYFHNNGAFFAEDFMFRVFVTCAMISDKSVNDAPLSPNTWVRLTRVPQAILNATEKYALNCLDWNVAMTRDQWEETIVYLRSCIKMGSTFDPFGYDETSSCGIMVRCLDGLINLSYMDASLSEPVVEILAPQPVRHFTHWEVLDTEKWSLEDDLAVRQKSRDVGVAPGYATTLDVGTTAKDLLDSILGSNYVPGLGHLAQPAGTSFCGSFGAIGARLVQTVKLASACQGTSQWFPTHG